MASALICLSKGQKFNFSKHIFDSLVRNVDSSSKFYMYRRFIQLIIQNKVGDLSTHTTRFVSPALIQKVFANMRRVGKGFLGVEISLFEGMLAARQPADKGLAEAQVQADDAVAAAVKENIAEDVAHDAIPSPPSHDIPSPSQEPSSPPQQPQSSPQAPPQGADFPTHIQQVLDVCSVLTRRVKNLEHANVAQKLEIIKLQARVKRLKKANKGRMIDDMDKDEEIELPSIPAAALIVVDAYTRRRKGVIIRDPKEELSLKTPAETPKVKDKGKGTTYAEICPIFQARFDENMTFLFKSREEMEEEDQEIIKSINETLAQKAAKRRKLSKEAQEAKDLRKHLEVVDDEDDDVFIEATPLARKVLVVDYQIVLVDNKPRFKIIKADETHQFYISFTTLLKNFDREDLENLWGIVKKRFSTSKPTNFSDEYLMLTLKTMFEKLDGQDAIWRNQKSVRGLALISTFKVHTGTIGECDKTSSRRRK
nr:hypothetical protein [Tanacetum cinerariifolium]